MYIVKIVQHDVEFRGSPGLGYSLLALRSPRKIRDFVFSMVKSAIPPRTLQ